MKTITLATTLRGVCALGAAAALVLGAIGCAAPAPDSDRADRNVRKQSELSAMEALGQRNEDRPLPK